MPITATYIPAQFKLAVLGTTVGEGITVSRNAAGTLLVNGGAVPVTGGTATVANTDLIEIVGAAGSDIITLDQALGALPAANLFGGAGHDTMTGGAGNDTLAGEDGNDILLGQGGFDLLQGGIGNDTLTGGDADDQMFGGDGDDRMVWNPGDDSDLMEGEAGSDTAEVNGGGGAEVFTVTANGTRVRFDRIDPAPFALDIGTTEKLVLNAGGGDDSISTTGNLAALISLTLDGGSGNDTILGSNGIDTLLGGDGNDFVDGQQGNDVAFLGAGNDVFQWDPGDGSDIVEGQADTDTLLFNGSAANEIFELSRNGGRTLLTRNLGNIVMDTDDVEAFTINALSGTDTITVNDLSLTGVTAVTVNLASTVGGSAGDASADQLIVNASNGANTINVTGAGTSFSVSGLAATITANSSEGANDSLRINSAGGNDTITATLLPAGVAALVIDSGTGADTILGSQGADTIFAGYGNDHVFGDNGNDTGFLGAGDDVFEWAPGDGNDVVEGQAGIDELLFTGSGASETINVMANGGRVLFLRDVASVTMDLDDVERVRYDALGGADNVTVGDLSGTDVTHVDVHLLGPLGFGDGAVDRVTANSTNGADTIAVSSAGGIVSASGLPVTVRLFDAEAANDLLTLNAQGGDDVIDAGALAAGFVSLTVNGGLGADLFLGSAAGDLFNGGDGNDTSLLGAGNDVAVWNPGDDNDTVEGQAGADTLRFNGSNVAETFTISANGGRVRFVRDIAAVTMDLNDTETIQLGVFGGADTIVLNDLSRTDLDQLTIDLASTAGGAAGDAQADALTLNASAGANTIDLGGATGALLTVTGLPASVTIRQFETGAGADSLTILALGGNDTISATGLVPHFAALTIDGGAGNDVIRSNGDGTYRGGTGNDFIFAGLTSFLEAIDGGTGVDTLDTTTFAGIYTVNLVTGATNFGGESFTNFENLVTGDGADTVVGTDGANIIETNGGDDTIDGLGGNDLLQGGAGNDLLDGGAGIDWADYADKTVSVSVALNGATNALVTVGGVVEDTVRNIERVQGGSAADTLVGDGLVNSLAGGAGNDVLSGGGGNDTLVGDIGNDELNGGSGGDQLVGGLGADQMVGGLGNDTYVVDNAGDEVDELVGEGTDHVQSSVTFSLAGEDIENLTLTGSNNINGTGNELANTLIGNSGNNRLSGGAGADQMAGGLGDDTYIVDNAGDVVDELSGEGTDLVRSSVTFSLAGEHVENLTLTLSANINGTGNTLANIIVGNSGDNVINGATGSDTLTGLTGSDSFVFADALGAANIDSITDFNVAADTIMLDSAIFATIVGTGVLSAAQFRANAAGVAGDVNDRIIYETDTGNLFFDSNGNAAGGSVQFAVVAAGLNLNNQDFFVV